MNKLISATSFALEYFQVVKSGFFDRDWYLRAYPDVKEAGIDPITHFLKFGGYEGRNPGPRFNTNQYCNTRFYAPYWKVNPLIHYLWYGKKQGITSGILKEDADPLVELATRTNLSGIELIKLKISREQILTDEEWTKKHYWLKFGRDLDLENPKTFNEKICAYKLFYREKPLWKFADKVAVREYVREKIGDSILVPLLGVYDNFEQINPDELPDKFIMKANHGSSWNMVCMDKKTFDWHDNKNRFNEWLGIDYYELSREWAYKDIEPKILIEELLLETNGVTAKDYKVMCSHGKPINIAVAANRFINKTMQYFDTNWNKLNKVRRTPEPEIDEQKPESLEKILNIARILSADFPFVRVDLFSIPDIYFGELTFYQDAGYFPFKDEKWDRIFGDQIEMQSVVDNAKNRIEV